MMPSAAALGHLETLIGFPTVSSDSNLGLIEWVRDELAGQGIRSRLTYDGQQRKANLFATVGAGRLQGGLVLSGHTDVVPEAGLFTAAGIPAVVCGPGSFDQAHKPNEYLSLAQLACCGRFLRKLIDANDSVTH